jgi:putative DNA primase/helicase
MTRLSEPLKIDLSPDWALVANSAGLYGDGTRVDVHLYYNGSLKDNYLFSLSADRDRNEYATKIAGATGLYQDNVLSHFLELKDQVEGLLRLMDVEDASQATAPEKQTIGLDDPEPWDDVVDGEVLISTLQSVVERFVALSKGASYAIALWIVPTYVLAALHITPILLITSPQPRCGKSTLMAVLRALTRRALLASNITSAALFRSIEKWQPTLLIDEADTFMRQNDELRGIVNSGHTRTTAHIIRCEGDNNEPQLFNTFAAKAIAGIGKQADTIMDRSIEIAMRRRLQEEQVQRFRIDRPKECEELARQCMRWAQDYEDAIRNADPEVPACLNDRAADNWRPLLQIADVAGGSCPDKAREALKALCDEESTEEESTGVMLLRDMQTCFQLSTTGRILSEDLLTFLLDIEDRPWNEWGRARKPITKPQIATLLRPFGIRPRDIRDGHKTGKGYRIEACQDAFSRYIPQPSDLSTGNTRGEEAPSLSYKIQIAGVPPSLSATPRQASNGAGFRENQSATYPDDVADEKARKASNDADCRGVADESPCSGATIKSDIISELY